MSLPVGKVQMIDKCAAYTALKHEQEMHELSFSREAYGKAARIIDQMPTILDIDRIAILRLCNEIEELTIHTIRISDKLVSDLFNLVINHLCF